MTFAFIIALIVAGTFFFLWQDAKEKLEEAEKQIRKLKRQQKQQKQQKTSKKKNGFATIDKSEAAREYAIPKPEPRPAGPFLDPRKLAELQKETKAAQNMLAEIFVQEDEAPVQQEARSDDELLMRVLKRLFDKDVWTRTEIAELVGPDVMIGNLLEKINDYACSRIDDIVLEEDGDRIYVTTEYKEELI